MKSINRLSVVGNVSISSGVTVSAANGVANQFYINGNVAVGTLTGAISPQIGLFGGTNQTLASDTALSGGVLLRNTSTTASANIVDTVGSQTPGSTLTVGPISFVNAKSSAAIQMLLSGNVTAASTPTASTTGTLDLFSIDTAGHTLSLGTAAETLSGTTNIAWSLLSGAGAGGTAGGQISAATFDLSGPSNGSIVGPALTLNATGAGGTTSNLSNANNFNGTGTPGTISPTSTFSYAGTATVSSYAKLNSSRTIGNLSVTAGALQLASAITTGTNSTTTIGTNGTLDLGAFPLTTTNLVANGVLSGTATGSSVATSGTLSGTGTVGAAGGITSAGTLAPAGVNTVGNLTIASGSGALTLGASSTAAFDFASDTSFDTMTLNGVIVNYAGTLSLNFTYTPAVGTTYTIFSGGPSETTNFASITSNLPDTEQANFDNTDGQVTIAAAPEPASMTVLGVACFGLLVRRRRHSVA